MLTKRIIACLDVDAGRVVKGVQFVELRDAGDPAELALTHGQPDRRHDGAADSHRAVNAEGPPGDAGTRAAMASNRCGVMVPN